MTGDDKIPEEVLRFIVKRIDSVPHLETLLLLWKNAARAWTVQEVAQRVYVSSDSARSILQDLARHKLILADQDIRYHYDAAWDEGQLMQTIADSYRRQLVRMANIIHSKASAAVRDFARAFQFKD